MKNLTRFILGMGLVGLLSPLGMATATARTAKAVFTTPYSLSPSSVTAFTVLESTSGVLKPGAVYQVTLSSGAASEFLVMFDSSSAQGITATLNNGTGLPRQVGPRLFFNTLSSNTVINFDPPLIFTNGLIVIDSAITGQGSITWEEGRGAGAQ